MVSNLLMKRKINAAVLAELRPMILSFRRKSQNLLRIHIGHVMYTRSVDAVARGSIMLFMRDGELTWIDDLVYVLT